MSFLDSYCRDKTPLVVDEIKWYATTSIAKARSTHIMISSGVSSPPCGRSDLQHEWESERWNRTTLEREGNAIYQTDPWDSLVVYIKGETDGYNDGPHIWCLCNCSRNLH